MSKLDCLCILHVFPYKSAACFLPVPPNRKWTGRKVLLYEMFDGLAEALKRVSCDVKRTVKQAQLPREY